MSWQHWILAVVILVGMVGAFVGIDEPRKPRDVKDAGAGLLFSLIMLMLLVWGQR